MQRQTEGVAAKGLTPMGRSYDVIVETAGGRGVDLIVMGIPGKRGLEIGNAGCAVLIVKGKDTSPATV